MSNKQEYVKLPEFPISTLDSKKKGIIFEREVEIMRVVAMDTSSNDIVDIEQCHHLSLVPSNTNRLEVMPKRGIGFLLSSMTCDVSVKRMDNKTLFVWVEDYGQEYMPYEDDDEKKQELYSCELIDENNRIRN